MAELKKRAEQAAKGGGETEARLARGKFNAVWWSYHSIV
jgi:hypothetical protein